MRLLAVCRARINSKTIGIAIPPAGAEVSRPCYQLAPHAPPSAAGSPEPGSTRDQTTKVLIAAGEAVANAIEHGHRHSPEGTISPGVIAASPAVGNYFAVYAVRRLSSEWAFDRMKLLVHRMGECAPCAGEKRQVLRRTVWPGRHPSINPVWA